MPSLSFYDAFDKQEDRLAKKRKENREAFEAYRSMKAELGENTSAEDLQRFRESLAGGDAFFLRDLGPGAMVEGLARRTNERAMRTRQAEEAARVKQVSDMVSFFDTFVGNNLDGDPTDVEGMKSKFMKLFPSSPGIAEQIWSQNSGRLTESIMTARASSSSEYLDLRLKDVDNLAEAQAIMTADGLPAWKQEAIKKSIQQRANTTFRTNASAALNAAETYEAVNLLYEDEAGLNKIADRIMAANQIYTSDPNYDSLRAEVLTGLKDRKENLGREETDKNQVAFAKAIRDPNNAFYQTIMAAGYDDSDLLEAYNELRAEHKLPLAESVEDEDFQKFKNSMENQEALQHEKRYNDEVTRLQQQGEAAFDEANGGWAVLGSYSDLATEGSAIQVALTALKGQGYAPVVSAAQIYQMAKNLGISLTDTMADGNIEQNIIANFKASGAFMTKTQMANATADNNTFVRPGTSWEQWVGEQVTLTEENVLAEIEAEIHSLPINATREQIDAKRQVAMDKLREAIEDMRAHAKANRGAFNAEIGEFITKIGELEAKMEKKAIDMFADADLMRGKALPEGAFINQPNGIQPTAAALAANPPFVDSDGNPLDTSARYNLVDGRLVLKTSQQAVPAGTNNGGTLPITSRGNPRNNITALVNRDLDPIKQALINFNPQLGAPVFGYQPDLNALPPGYRGPQAEIASLIAQFANAYGNTPVSRTFSNADKIMLSNPAKLAELLGFPQIAASF